MLEKAVRLCEGTCGHLYIYDGERFHQAAVDAAPLVKDWWRQFGPVQVKTYDTPLGRLVAGERVIRIVDAREDPGYRSSRGFRELVNVCGFRSGIVVALDEDDALRGAITIYRQELRPFSDRQIALLQNFAQQAVIAMENARLITEPREAVEQQTATAEVLGVINSSPGNLTPVFDAILDKALDLCGAAFGNLWIYEGGLFQAKALQRAPQGYTDHLLRTSVSGTAKGTVLGQLHAGNASAQVADAAAEEDYTKTGARGLVDLGGGRTVAGVALRRDQELLGAITIYRQEVRPFTDKQIALLQNFAAQAVIAMENARLLGELRQRTNEVAE